MTTIYQYLRSLVNSNVLVDYYFSAPSSVPTGIYSIVEEGDETVVTPFYSGGTTSSEPLAAKQFTISISLFGAAGKDATTLVPLYQRIQREAIRIVNDHPGVAFMSMRESQGNIRPVYNNTIERVFAQIRFEIFYLS